MPALLREHPEIRALHYTFLSNGDHGVALNAGSAGATESPCAPALLGTIVEKNFARELILVLMHLVSRGSNFLLDIGPTGNDRIPVIMQDRLIQIGKWPAVNGGAIYGTRFAGRDCQ